MALPLEPAGWAPGPVQAQDWLAAAPLSPALEHWELDGVPGCSLRWALPAGGLRSLVLHRAAGPSLHEARA